MSMVTHLSAALMYTFFLVFLGEDTSHEELEISSDKGETGPRDEVEGFMIFDFKMLSTVLSCSSEVRLATECQRAMTCFFFRDQLFVYTCRVQPRSGCKTERMVGEVSSNSSSLTKASDCQLEYHQTKQTLSETSSALDRMHQFSQF